MKIQAIFVVSPLLIAACSTYTEPVQMIHPQTGELRTCGPYFLQNNFDGVVQSHEATAIAQEAQCIRDYKEQGYVRK